MDCLRNVLRLVRLQRAGGLRSRMAIPQVEKLSSTSWARHATVRRRTRAESSADIPRSGYQNPQCVVDRHGSLHDGRSTARLLRYRPGSDEGRRLGRRRVSGGHHERDNKGRRFLGSFQSARQVSLQGPGDFELLEGTTTLQLRAMGSRTCEPVLQSVIEAHSQPHNDSVTVGQRSRSNRVDRIHSLLDVCGHEVGRRLTLVHRTIRAAWPSPPGRFSVEHKLTAAQSAPAELPDYEFSRCVVGTARIIAPEDSGLKCLRTALAVTNVL